MADKYKYNIGYNPNATFNNSQMNGFRSMQGFKRTTFGDIGGGVPQPTVAEQQQGMGQPQPQQQGAPTVGQTANTFGKAGQVASGVISAGANIIDDVNNYRQLSAQDPTQMVDRTYYDPYSQVGQFTEVQNPYTKTAGQSIGGSAGKYAAAGASIGSAFGPWGTLIGGAVGGIGGAIGGAFEADKIKEQRNKFNTAQEQARQQYLMNVARNRDVQQKMQQRQAMQDYLTRSYARRFDFNNI